MNFYLSLLLLFLLTLGGSLSFFWIKKPLDRLIRLFLTFSGAYLLGVTLLKLFPHVFEHAFQPGIYILGGFLLQMLLESLSKGIEHGHLHIGKPAPYFPWSITIGLAIHAFLEGMPLSNAFSAGSGLNTALYLGIVFHKIPAAFVLFTVMMNYKTTYSTILTVLITFSLMTPLGALISDLFFNHQDLHHSFTPQIIMGVVVGAFLHIGSTIIYEAQDKHQFSPYQILSLILGFLLATLTSL